MAFSKIPDISVVMACYNSSEFLEEAIKSVLGQTLGNFEFIIVDDGSTDRTREIIKTFAARDGRIVFRPRDVNSGPAVARNLGTKLARGKWIAILDSDDVAFPNRLELQIEYIESHPDVVLLGSACIEIDPAGIYVKKHQYPNCHHHLVNRLEKLGAFFPHSSCMYRKESLNEIGDYNFRYVPSEDYDLWLRFSEVGHLACLSQPLIMLRNHVKSISNHNCGMTQIINWLAAGVCHFLRQMNALDPSRLGDTEWCRFIDWLTVRLKQKGYFDRMRFHHELRQTWYFKQPKPFWRKTFDFTKLAIIHPGHFIRIAWDSFFDSTLPAELADEWLQLTVNTSHRPITRQD